MMLEILQRFHRDERLKSRKSIARLFATGKSMHVYPVRVIFAVSGEERSTKIIKAAFSVPKRSIRKACLRNRIKRRMKEAYRLNKLHLISTCKSPIDLIFIYAGKDELEYVQIEKAIKKLVAMLTNTFKAV